MKIEIWIEFKTEDMTMRLGELVQDTNISMKVFSDDELEQLHAIILGILDDFISICESNKLKYYFIGGSAIGALRHHGFIPWDNDIDLAMPRQDFLIFQDIIKRNCKNKYSIINPSDDKNYGRILPKLRKLHTIYRTILEQDLEECGVFMDIYIIENAFDNFPLRLIHGGLCLAAGFTLSCRRAYEKKNLFLLLCGDRKKQKVVFYLKYVIGLLFSFASIETVAKWTNACYSMCKNENSKYIIIPSDDLGFYFGNIYKRRIFLKQHKVEFEGREIYVPGNYKEYLTEKYGDYMQIPSTDKRKKPLYLELKLFDA